MEDWGKGALEGGVEYWVERVEGGVFGWVGGADGWCMRVRVVANDSEAAAEGVGDRCGVRRLWGWLVRVESGRR